MTDRTYHGVIRAFRGVFALADLQCEVRGAEHVPANGPAVLACNHVSYLDFTFVGLAAGERGRLVRFMAKASTFANPVSGPLMRRMGHIPVEREGVAAGAVAYRRAIRAVQAGELVGVFPEATISRSWTLREFKPGAVALAVRERVPLVPLVTWGGHRIASVDGHIHPRRHVPVRVLVGPPVPVTTREETGPLLRAAMQELLDTAQREYPEPGPGTWWEPLHRDGTAPTPGEAAVREAEVEAARVRKARRAR